MQLFWPWWLFIRSVDARGEGRCHPEGDPLGATADKEHAMCRWMAWLGQPVLIEELVFKTQHGIVDQSLHARMGAEPTNGDGFGLGWYGTGEGPGLYHSIAPAWGDANLHELAAHIESPLFMVHVRAAIGSPVQQTNCHPFRHGRWLFVHNGFIADFHLLRRELMLAIDPALFANVQGSTDTEVVFQLALTFGLEQDPIRALERTVGLIESTARSHGVDDSVQASFGVSDGTSLWAVRYATNGRPRSLFASADPDTIKQLHPDNPRLQRLSSDDRLIVSEPFSDLPGDWHEIPAASAVTVRYGGVLERRPFQPQPVAAPQLSPGLDG
jgi:glutamine amidotransferase